MGRVSTYKKKLQNNRPQVNNASETPLTNMD